MRLKSRFIQGNDDLIVLFEDEALPESVTQSLLPVKAEDWNRDLSPWPSERVFEKGDDFAGEADETLKELIETVQPYRKEYKTITLAGYSLAGLFSLYACTKTDLFDQCLSASGSLWYPGWIEYLQDHPVRCKKVYLSLGDKEKNTRNEKMASVEENTYLTKKILEGYTDVILEMNPGNHFQEPDKRIIKGIQALTA